MRVLYIDINTGAYNFARFHSHDYVLNKYTLKGKGGQLFKISQWQFVAYCSKKK